MRHTVIVSKAFVVFIRYKFAFSMLLKGIIPNTKFSLNIQGQKYVPDLIYL